MHGRHHANQKLINPVAFFHQWNERSNAAFVRIVALQIGKDELLERIKLVQENNKIINSLVSFIWIVDSTKRNVFFIVEGSGKHGIAQMKLEFLLYVFDIRLYQCSISTIASLGAAR